MAVDDPVREPIGRPAFNLARAYGPVVRTSPALWGILFRSFSRQLLSQPLDRFLLQQLVPAMAGRSRLRSPRVVVSCHPLLGPSARSAAGPGPALVTMMTDLVGGHRGWLSPRPDTILTATEQATNWCLGHGVPAHLIQETGLPIDPDLVLGSGGPSRRRQLRLGLGLDPEKLCVLVGGGAEGVGSMKQLVQWLGSSGLPLQVVVACGNNLRLRAWLARHPQPAQLLALDFQSSLTPWLQSADVYLGKAGPSTLAEAAAAGLALLITEALPGQEEDNGAVLAAAGAARQIRGRDHLISILASCSRPGDPLLGELQRGSRAWSRPQAADAAAEVVLSFLEGAGSGSRPRARTSVGSGPDHLPRR